MQCISVDKLFSEPSFGFGVLPPLEFCAKTFYSGALHLFVLGAIISTNISVLCTLSIYKGSRAA
jgi:hypothetical protein